MPRMWSQGHNDWTYIKSVHKKFGTKKLNNYPHYSWAKMQWYRNISGIKWINILEFVDYKKLDVIEILKKDLEWVPLFQTWRIHLHQVFSGIYTPHQVWS